MRHAVTPVWNACVAEREIARKLYREKLDEAFCDIVQELRRDLTDKEEKKIRIEVGKMINWPSAYDQYKNHVRKRDHPEYANYSAKMLECTVAQVESSENSFRALWLKGNKKARPPKQTELHSCITFRQSGWKPKDYQSGRLYFSGIGSVRVRLHRPIEGVIKTVSIKEKNHKWYVCFSCEIDRKSGMCSPVSGAKPGDAGSLRQEYTQSGGADPEKAGTYNSVMYLASSKLGGADPEKSGTYNETTSTAGNSMGGAGPEKAGEIKIAFGLRANVFIADSDGFIVEHPEFYTSDIVTLERLNQSLRRKTKWLCNGCDRLNEKYRSDKKGKYCIDCGSESISKSCSNNWYKARHTLRKWHEKIKNKRAYYLWHQARFYAENYERVTIQKWPLSKEIEYSTDNKTARKLCDGAYGLFVKMLKHKCNELGTEFIERKDLSWQKEIERITEQAKMQQLLKVLRKAKAAVKRNYPARFKCLVTACERLTMLRI